MEEFNNQDTVEDIIEEEELGISDKIVGVLTEPGNLFSGLSKFPIKTMDWFLPILLVIIFASISNFVLMSNPEIKADIIEKQMQQMEKNFQEAVDKGQMTQAQADEQLDNIYEQMEKGGTLQIIISTIGITIVTFIVFFIIAGVFLLLSKSALGGEGNYKISMLAYGMPYYIIVIQITIMIIAAIGMNKMFIDTSIGSFMGIEKDSIVGWFMHKLDPLSIWFYAVVSIAYAKMFKSDNTMKYFIMIFGMWIGFSLLLHFAAQALPFLKWFGM